MNMKYFVNAPGYAPLMKDANGRVKVSDLSYGMVVSAVEGYAPVPHLTLPVSWICVRYDIAPNRGFMGWVTSNFLEHYLINYYFDAEITASIDTESLVDAAQYVNYNGVQVNMCGELCAALILGVSLKYLLDDWQIKALPFYKRIFRGGRATGTSSQDLKALLNQNGADAVELVTMLHDPILKQYRYTPEALQRLCKDGWVIAGVSIDSTSGGLRGGGIGHWVIVLRVTPERTGGLVDVWNPFTLSNEIYSWREFAASAKSPSGVWVRARGIE